MAAVVKRKCHIPLRFRSIDFHVTENATRHITKQYEQTKKVCRPPRRSSAQPHRDSAPSDPAHKRDSAPDSAQQQRPSAPVDSSQKRDSAPQQEGVSFSQISDSSLPRPSAPRGPSESAQEGGVADTSQHSANLSSQMSTYGSSQQRSSAQQPKASDAADGRAARFHYFSNRLFDAAN